MKFKIGFKVVLILVRSHWILYNMVTQTNSYNKSKHGNCSMIIMITILKYIPLISQKLGLYGELWTEFFPFFYGPSTKHAGHENKEGKNENP